MTHFVPECYFDTVLVRRLLVAAEIWTEPNHQKGCPNVLLTMVQRLFEHCAVGIIDKDKRELKSMHGWEVLVEGHLNLHKHPDRPQFIIQLAPALESWVLRIGQETGVSLADFDLPDTLLPLRNFTKGRLVNEDIRIKRLSTALLETAHPDILLLKQWLTVFAQEGRGTTLDRLMMA